MTFSCPGCGKQIDTSYNCPYCKYKVGLRYVNKIDKLRKLAKKLEAESKKKSETAGEYIFNKGDGRFGDITGIKPRSPQQITRAGFTLVGGYIALPFIKINNARNYRFKGIKKEVK